MKKPVILCVDDEPLVLESVVGQLKAHYGNRFIYEVANNANEAEELIDELLEDGHHIPVLISDWLMPMTKGDQFLINVFGKLPDTKLVMLSGHAEQEAIDRAKEFAKLYRFIRKPWDKSELLTCVDTIVQHDKKLAL